ncbi:MAG: ASCH domain-containing protein [Coriobacteriaceae bacterium]|nr:ASCH domain-containing protein [Coriobacteriaceae bacterium]
MEIPNINELEHWHFELTESACNHLLDLVLEGKKRATSSSLPSFQLAGEMIPKAGDLSVITDWDGIPRCVVMTTAVRVMRYGDITFDIAKLEGEDDSLESWRRNHERFFREEGVELGYSFSDDLDVVFEEFEVVEVLPGE